MERKELKEAIISAIVEENGHLTAKEICISIYGKAHGNREMAITEILQARENRKTFARKDRRVGYTLTDQKWDEIEKERSKHATMGQR